MLRLERMEVSGFKSFGDRTEILFPEGITAVVGPNGCGKSNIGDAINWVLGEQSAKMLRGHQMADVIFSGSEARKPLGMAEVSLIFCGAEGLAAGDQGKVTVTRRLFRSGESEYRPNGARTRLMDIQELLRRAKVGARTYATIEQGKIDQVLNAKPKDRRGLIEDAAGISGYKHKRRLSELRLEATYANLLRVNDIITEVQRQINSLKRQAAKARRYRRLREELRAMELTRFSRRAREMEEELSRLRQAEDGARDTEAQSAARLGRLDARLLELRGILEEKGRRLRGDAERQHELDIEIDREEAQIRSCRERQSESRELAERHRAEVRELATRHQEAEARSRKQEESIAEGGRELQRLADELTRWQAGQEAAEADRTATREAIERLRVEQFETVARAAELRNREQSTREAMTRSGVQRRRLESERAQADEASSRIRQELESLERQWGAHCEGVARSRSEQLRCEGSLRELRQKHSTDLEALSDAREHEQSALARLATLEDVETRFTGVSDGVKTLLGSAPETGIRTHGVVADYVEASREVEGAAEGYLQWLLPTVVLEDDGDVSRAAALLRSAGAGRTSLVCRHKPAGGSGNGHSELPRELFDDRRVIGRLRDRLKVKSGSNGMVADRIGNAVLVDTLESALDLHRRHPEADYLTPDGDVVYASGMISAGGRPARVGGLLAHRRRVQELRLESEQAAARTAGLQQAVEAARDGAGRLERELAGRRQELEDAERRGVELKLNVERARAESEQSGRRSAVLADELASVRAEVDPLEQSLAEITREAQRAEQARSELEQSLVDKRERLERAESELKQRLERVTELRAEQAAMGQRQEAAEREGRRLSETLGELASRLETARSQADAAQARAAEAAELEQATEADLVRHLEERKRLGDEVQRMERELAELRETLSGVEGELRSVRTELEALREKTREAEMARMRGESDREHLDDLCRQELGIDAAAASSAGEPTDEEADADLEALEAQIEAIKEKLERIGPVNMTAIEEFSELEERFTFLSEQRKDLEQSMESLKETIRRINRQSRQRFTEAFEAIRSSYQEVYRLLFSGGRADLRLEEGEDVLECGIDILAQPPGKRLTGVHLLSGGEKALSAIALLFAIFRYQPSPFCLLDEVDAALDDVNVVRFTKMVQEYAKNTQFVLITHNKLSMESADLLYGVTMEEPGVSKLVSLQFQ